MCDTSSGSSSRTSHQDPLLTEGPTVRRGLQQLYPEVRVQKENYFKLNWSLKPFQVLQFLYVCPLQCAVCLRGAPEAAEGARWNKERSRERVREGGTTN